MPTNLGRISGPLLKSTLTRDGVDLQIQNTINDPQALLKVDVNNGRIGIGTSIPTTTLDVAGTANVNALTVETGITTKTITSPTAENLVISPGAGGTVQILGFEVSNTAVSFDVDEIVANNLRLSGDGDATTVESVSSNTDLFINSAGTGNVIINGVNFDNTEGNSYFVTVNGSDTNSGTGTMDAFASVRHACSVATFGDTIYIGAGTFTEITPIEVPAGVQIIGSGLRTTQLQPDATTRNKDFFGLNGEVTIEDMTIKGIEWQPSGNPEVDLTTESSFTSSTAAVGDRVGWSVAVGNNKIIVGAKDDAGGIGRAFIYNLDGSNELELSPSNGSGGDAYGSKVAVGESKVVVAAPNQTTFTGSVYIYETDGSGEIIVTASDSAISNYFGNDIAIGDSKIVVGTQADKVYTYNLTGTSEAIITPSDSPTGFGQSVAAGDGKIVVGAPSNNLNTGKVYIFDNDGTNEIQIVAPDAAQGDFFGASVAINGNKIAVGAYGENGGAGAVYVYEKDGTYIGKASNPNPNANDRFGWDVAIENEKIITGAYANSSDTGEIYTIYMNAKLPEVYVASDGANSDSFGFSVAAGNNIVVVGAPGDGSSKTGKVYTYDFVGAGSGYALCYQPGADIQSRSSYVKNITILNRGSSVRLGTNAADDPYGFDAGDAGRGIIVDGAKIAPGSIEPAMLFSDVTIFSPNNVGLVLKDGARAEWLNSFVYFADQGILATAGTKGAFGQGKTKITLSGITGTFQPGDEVTFTSTDSSTVVTVEVDSVDGNTILIDGRIDDFDGFDTTPANISATPSGATASSITLYDRKDFGAELRSISSANVYGNHGVKADGPDVRLRLSSHDFGYIGAGKSFDNIDSEVITANEVTETNGGKVFYNSTDQYGDFRIGDLFLVDQETGSVSFQGGDFDVQSLTGITFSDGGNTTIVDPTKIQTGSITIAGDEIRNDGGNVRITSPLVVEDPLTVTGNSTFQNPVQMNSTLDVNGQTTVASLNVEDLTVNRVVYTDVNGELRDNANLQYNGSIFTVTGDTVTTTLDVTTEATLQSAIISDLTATRIPVVGTAGAIEDHVDLTYTTGTSTLNVAGQANLASANVSDLTDTRLVYAGTGGELQDSANMTFDGTDLTVASAIVSDLTDNRVLIAGVNGALEDNANLTYDGSTLTVNNVTFTGSTIAHTGGPTQTIILDANLQINGTTTTVNSTTITVDDPIFTLGGDTAPASNDSKDRGVEFRWHDGATAKVGFFGFDESTGNFTFIPDATNSSEVFSGGTGRIDVGSAQLGNLTTGRVPFASTDGLLIDAAELTYNTGNNTLTVDGDLTVTGTFSQSAGAGGSTFNSLQIDDLFFDENKIAITTSGQDLDIDLYNDSLMNVGGGMTVAGSITPVTGKSFDLGTQEKSFRNLYLGAWALEKTDGYLADTNDKFQNLKISNQGLQGFLDIENISALTLPVGTTAQRPKIPTATPAVYNITVGYDGAEGAMTVSGDLLVPLSINVGDTVNILNNTGEDLYIKNTDTTGAGGSLNVSWIQNQGATNGQTVVFKAVEETPGFGTLYIKMFTTEVAGLVLASAEAVDRGKLGQVRFNTDDTRFEGYNGIDWIGLGGVADVDQDTFVRAETAPGDDNDAVQIVTENVTRAQIDSNGLQILTSGGSSDTGLILDGRTISTPTGALTLAPYNNGEVIISGDLIVQGTTTQVDSTTVTVADPILELGSGGVADGFDRGLKLTYNNGGIKAAFLGLDDSSTVKEFVYIADATDTNNVFSGTLGQAAFGSLRVTDLTAYAIPFITTAADGDQDNQLKAASNFLFNGTAFQIGDNQEFSVDATTGQLTTSSVISTALADDSVVFATGGGNLSADPNFTWDGTALNITGAISMTGNIVPTVDSDGTTGYDLGAVDQRWRDLYLSGGSLFLNELKIGQDPATGDMAVERADGGPINMNAHRIGGTEAQFGEVEIIGNTISSVTTNGDIILQTQGTGRVEVPGDIRVQGTIIVENQDTDEVTFNVQLSAPSVQTENISIVGNVIETTATNSDLTLRAAGTGEILMPTDNVNIADGSLYVNGIIENPILRVDQNTITTLATEFDLELTAFGEMEVAVPLNDLRVDQTLIANQINVNNKVFIGTTTDQDLQAIVGAQYDGIIEARLGSNLYLNSVTGTVEVPTTDVNFGQNVTIDGTNSVTGLSTLGSVNIPNIPQNRIVFTDNAGLFTSDENFRMFGTTVDYGNGNVIIGAGNGNISAVGDVTVDGELDVNTKIRAATLNIENIREDMIPFVNVTGQIVGNRGFTYEEDIAKLTVPNLDVDQLTFTGNTISSLDTAGDIIIDAAGTGLVIFDGDQAIQVPVGGEAVRPSGAIGQIRFNSDKTQFEGYTDQWTPLGGVRDADNDTFILPETTPGSDDDVITMTIASVERFRLSATELTTTGVPFKNGTLVITDGTISSEVNEDIIITSNGTGKVDLQAEVTISGNLDIGDDAADTVTFVGVVDSNILPDQDGIRDLGSASNSWNNLFLDGTATVNIANLTSVDIDGGNIDGTVIGAVNRAAGSFTTLNANDQVTFSGNIASVDSATGTVAVTGGVGISQNLNVGQNSVFTGDATVNGTFSATSTVNMNGAAAAISIQPTGAGTVTIRPGIVGAIDDMAIGANSASSGAFTTLTANNAVTFTQNVESTTSTSGTLQVTGGIGATGNINIDGSLGVGTDATITGDTQINGALTVNPVNNSISFQPTGTGTVTIFPGVVGSIDRMNIGATNRGTGAFTTLTANSLTTITDTTGSTLTTNGALVVDGGVGIAENVNIGGNINASEATFTGAINLSPANANVTISPTGTGEVIIQPVGGLTINPTAIGNIDNVNIGGSVPGDAVFNDVTVQGTVAITDTTQSNNPDEGALVVEGGVGIYKNLHVGQYAEIDAGILVRGIAGTNSDFYTNIRTDDKILTIGGVVPPNAATSTDRGIEFRWHDGANDKIGFFGYQDSTGYFVFKPDGSNTGDVYSGDTGTINATFLGDLTSTNVTITGGTINGTTIGATTRSTADVTDFDASGNVVLGEDDTKLLTINAEIDTNLIPSTDNTYDLGASGNSWKDLFLGGTLDTNTMNALNVDIDGGAIDNTVIGGVTPSSGAFTTLAANDQVTFTAGTSSTTTLTGTAVITGGVGISENVNAGGKGTFVGLESTGAVTFDPANAAISLQPTGLGSVTIAPGTTGAIDNMNIGAATRGTGAFTTLQANDQVTFNAGVNSTAANNGTVVVAGGVGISQDLFVGGNQTITGNLTVNGTTTTVNSTTVTVDDPIMTLGGDTAPTLNDGKDRGIEFRYYGTQIEPSKLGFMGWNNSSGKFTMLLNVTNQSEVITGDTATLQANLEGNVLAQSATINAGFINGTEIGTTTPDVGVFTDLTSNGNTIIGDANLDTLTINAYISSSLIPSSAGLDIGSLTNQWNDIYIDGIGFIDSLEADTVDINGGTIDAVTLGTNSAITEAQIDNVNINGNTITATNTDGDLTITPDGVGTVIINTNQAMKIPVGTEVDRPGGEAGQIRFNTDNEKFEGYIGTVWTTLGGVRDADGDTFIAPELTPGSNDDTIFFYVGGVEVATLDNTNGFILNVGTITAAAFDITDTTLSTTTSNADLLLSPNGTGSVVVTSTNPASGPNSGALVVQGGLGVGQNVQIGNDLIVQGSTTLGDDNVADNVVMNADVEVNMQDNAFTTFVVQNVNTGDSSLDKYIEIDTINAGEKITFGAAPKIEIQNTTTSTNSTSGALTVAGGLGVAENLNVGGNLFVTGNIATDDTMIKLANAAVDQNDDIGFYGKYNDGVIRYRGLFSDASSDKKFRLFKDTIEEPSSDVNITATGYTVGTLIANIEGGTISNLTSGIGVADGGTGQQSFTAKGILYGNGTDAIQASPRAGTQDQTQSAQLLTVDGTGSPVWTETIDGGSF